MVFITHCDSPAFWQTYLSDPASITMEGILFFNKHLLFLLTMIFLFIFKLVEKQKHTKLIWKFFLQNMEGERRENLIPGWNEPWTLVVKIWVKESINLREVDLGSQATAQIYLTNSLVSIPAPYYHLTANRAMADFIVAPGRAQDVVNEIRLGWHLHDPTWMSANLHTWDLETDNFDLTIRPINPNQPLPRFGVTNGIITVRD